MHYHSTDCTVDICRYSMFKANEGTAGNTCYARELQKGSNLCSFKQDHAEETCHLKLTSTQSLSEPRKELVNV